MNESEKLLLLLFIIIAILPCVILFIWIMGEFRKGKIAKIKDKTFNNYNVDTETCYAVSVVRYFLIK